MLRRLVVRIIFLGSLSLALVAVSGLPAAAQPTVTVELGQTPRWLLGAQRYRSQ
jgi:hypothetical protein